MSHRNLLFAVLYGLLLAPFAGCADARQDQVEIPVTIGEVQDAGKPQKSTVETTTAKQEPAPAAKPETQRLESQPPKQDLVTLMRREKEEFEKQTIEIPDSWRRMGKDSQIWVDVKKKQVIIRGAICIDDGMLEMFACPSRTKEHEAIVSAHGKASQVHATLLALNINPGMPMVWREEYFPAHGPVMNIEVWWTDEGGNLVKRRAQDMIRNTDTGKAMACDFVFGGSIEIYDPFEKKSKYYADDGPMINVANQPDAMIDVSIESSEAEHGSLFEAFTENVPAVNTKVYIVLSASDKKVDAKKGKPTIEELKEEDKIRREALEKRLEELRKGREKAEAAWK